MRKFANKSLIRGLRAHIILRGAIAAASRRCGRNRGATFTQPLERKGRVACLEAPRLFGFRKLQDFADVLRLRIDSSQVAVIIRPELVLEPVYLSGCGAGPACEGRVRRIHLDQDRIAREPLFKLDLLWVLFLTASRQHGRRGDERNDAVDHQLRHVPKAPWRGPPRG
jgi:hypothetical protein